MTLRTIIADDEPLAVRRLEIALERIKEIEIVGVARNGREALDLVRSKAPDLLLVDIMMPEMDGLGLVQAIDTPAPPAVIFVTAYDQFALKAFEEGAVDYVLKPVGQDRLEQSIERARQGLRTRDAARSIEKLRATIETLTRERDEMGADRFERHLWIGMRGSTVRLALTEVDRFHADGDYVIAHAGGREHILNDSLAELENRLNPDMFLRVHRSAIVRQDAIRAIERLKFGTIQLRLFDGTAVKVSRTYRKSVLDKLLA
jgi:two-component system LytT family response regulator